MECDWGEYLLILYQDSYLLRSETVSGMNSTDDSNDNRSVFKHYVTKSLLEGRVA